jgi:hypothetical protein
MPEVIANTSPLKYLHQLRLFHLLHGFYLDIQTQAAILELANE